MNSVEKYTQKYTFIHENKFNGSKLTLETESESLSQLLTDFADFLRGVGFHIDGYLDVVSYDEEPEDYSDHYDTAEEMPENCCESENCLYESFADDHPEANFDWPSEISTKSITENDIISLCPVCKLDTNMMKNHSCFDKNCPGSN